MKKFILLSILIFLSGAIVNSQTDTTVYDATSVDEEPHWPGCDILVGKQSYSSCWNQQFHKFLDDNLTFPMECHECAGKIWIEFIIETDGSLFSIKVLKSAGQPLDDEVVKAIRHLPIFTPAKKNGNPVRFRYRMPINILLR